MADEDLPFVIWGSGGMAKKLFDVVSMNGAKVVALFDRNPHAKSVIEGVPIYYGEDGLRQWIASGACEMPCNALAGVGWPQGSERIELLDILSQHGFLTPSVLHPTAFVSPSAKMSRGCAVFTYAIVDAHSSVGEACVINDAARVGHDCVLGKGVFVAPGAMLLGNARIGDKVLIGANAVVLPGVGIGANSTVGAGAVVVKDLPPHVVAMGNPARIVRAENR